MKECSRCKLLLSGDCFHRQASAKDGKYATCKQCCKILNNEPERAQLRRNVVARYYAQNKDRYHARDAVRRAVNSGRLVPEPCFVCGSKAIAHHSTYDRSYWLDVTWLCVAHHMEAHGGLTIVRGRGK